MFGRLFDERYKAAAAGVIAYSPVRVLLCGFAATFIGLSRGWEGGVAWALSALTAEAVMLLVARAVVRRPAPAAWLNWTCFAIYALAVPVWSMAGVLLWSAESHAAQLAGAAFFAGHMMYLQTHHAHSPGTAIPVLPSILIPAVLPLVVPNFSGADQWVVCLTLGAVVLNSLLSMYVSLTKSLALQEAQAAMQAASHAKSEFLARMSHEIRTPLNGVLGMTQALAGEKDLTASHRQSLAVIRQSGESLLAVLNDVLDLSKVEAGRLELEEIIFDLEETVSGAQETFAPQAAAKGLGFRVVIEPDVAGAYRGDPTRVRQILYNLLSNAVKFTDRGEVSMSVARGAEALEIVVADTGIGIPSEHLGRLFGRFQQVDSSTTRRYGGSGLGLSICRELAELMGGSITVESTPGEGTRFILVLPLSRVSDAVPRKGLDADTLEAGLAAGEMTLRILAAEDNPVNQLVLKTLLAQVGIEPVMVSDGAQALEAWRSAPFDLVLMDVQMPVLDGVAATQLIRTAEAAEGRARTPILALTANAMSHQVSEYMASGFDGHVAKPIDARRLYEAIAEAARIAPASDERTAAA